jgi:tetratricopeptide (TPR) repeat protein
MARISRRALMKLPQTDETWQVAVAQLRMWITPPDETPRRPYTIFVFSTDNGAMMGADLVEFAPTADDVREVLFKAMGKPAQEVGPARRPQAVGVPDSALSGALAASLAELDVEVFERELPEGFGEIVRDLESHMRGDRPELPGLLSVKGVTPALADSFFAAAAEFYRAAPWVHLTNNQIVAVRHPAEPDFRYAVVMGNGGVEYGLAVYLKWSDVEDMYAADHPTETIPASGVHSLFYDAINLFPFDDLDALQEYGWQIANERAYPIAVVVDKALGPRRPSLVDLLWYEAALRAIPILVRDYLKPDRQGDYQPVEAPIEVPTHAGPVSVIVKYPGGEILLADRPAQEMDWIEDEDDEVAEEMPFFDRRGMEGMLAQIVEGMGEDAGPGDPNLDRAQEIMYQVWDERNPAKRLAMAHKALSISPNCTDAYVLLAEEEADTVGRALEYYQQGVAAGERALGPDYFKHDVGHFWGILETRPYMRARKGLADTLWRLNRREEAVEHYRDMLRLNEGDNQGIRYLLVDLYLQLDRDADAAKVLRKYRDDWSAVWKYTQALLEFRKSGASARANNALAEASEQNTFVPAYLVGKKRIPQTLPEYIGIGDEPEAIAYAADHLNHWRRTPGAVDWLTGRMAVQPPAPAPRAKPMPRRESAGASKAKGRGAGAARPKRKAK